MKKINLLLATPLIAYALSSCEPKIVDNWNTDDFTLTETTKEIRVEFPLKNFSKNDTVLYSHIYVDLPPFGNLDRVDVYKTINLPGKWTETSLAYSCPGSNDDKIRYAKICADYTMKTFKSD
ncbi:MAG: hypothetical protein ACP5N1_02535 [Candidatus Woesearchaeota archaeon]